MKHVISSAWSATKDGHWEQAVELWNSVLNSPRANPPVFAYVRLSEALRKCERINEAERLIERALARFPKHATVLAEYARISQEKGDLATAVERLVAFIETAESIPEKSYWSVSMMLGRYGHYDNAYMVAEKGQHDYPGSKRLRIAAQLALFRKQAVARHIYVPARTYAQYSTRYSKVDSTKTAHVTVRRPTCPPSQMAVLDRFMTALQRQHHGDYLFSSDHALRKLEDCFFVTPPHIVLDRDGLPVEEYMCTNSSFVLKHLAASGAAHRSIPDDAYIFTRLGVNNYYHWSSEMLPLANMCERRSGTSHVNTVLVNPTRMHLTWLSFLKDIGMFNGELTIIECQQPLVLHFRRLFVPWFPKYHLMTMHGRDFVTEVKRKISDNWSSQAGNNLKIYASRAGSRIENEDTLIRHLANRGFQIVDNSRLTIEEQVLMYARANVVVGVHGANLANAVFMDQGGKVLEIMSTRLTHKPYVVNSSIFGFEHGLIFQDGEDWNIRVDDKLLSDIDLMLHRWGC